MAATAIQTRSSGTGGPLREAWTSEAADLTAWLMVRRSLKKHGYPPDPREEATRTVLEQAELLMCGLGVGE